MRFSPVVTILCAALAPVLPREAFADEPNVVSLTGSALKKADAGDFAGAVSDLTRAIALVPDSASLRYERAKCSARLGDVAATESDLGSASKLSPDEYPMDLAVWRQATEESRRRGGSKEPNLALVQAEVAAIRGRAFANSVASGAKTTDELAVFVDGFVEANPRGAAPDGRSAGLARLGLVSASFDVKKETAQAILSQVVAYYDPREKKFFSLRTGFAPQMVEAIAAHELVHALQDQRFDLLAWFAEHGPNTPGVRDDDRAMALRCVAEGEATFVQTVWQFERTPQKPGASARRLARERLVEIAEMSPAEIARLSRGDPRTAQPGAAAQKPGGELEHIEPYVLAPLVCAYLDGARLVATVENTKQGWAAVDRLFTSPPETTEQCLHPEKWLTAPDRPARLVLPETPGIAAAGWTASDAAVHGELYLRVLLARHVADTKAAAKGAAGWDGDLYRAWQAKDGRTAIVLATTWDTVRDAQEFFDAYRAGLPKKYAKLAEEPGSNLTAIRYAYGDASLGTGALVLSNREVFAVEGFDAALREDVVAALVAMKVERVE